MFLVVAAYVVIAVVIAVKDYRKPHSETFGQSQHLQNSVIGAILWPAGAMLLAMVYMIGLVSKGKGRARANRPLEMSGD